MVLVFSILRINSNGYHCGKYINCFFLTNFLLFFCLFITHIEIKCKFVSQFVNFIFYIFTIHSLYKILKKNSKESKFNFIIIFICIIILFFKLFNYKLINLSLIQTTCILVYFLKNDEMLGGYSVNLFFKFVKRIADKTQSLSMLGLYQSKKPTNNKS